MWVAGFVSLQIDHDRKLICFVIDYFIVQWMFHSHKYRVIIYKMNVYAEREKSIGFSCNWRHFVEVADLSVVKYKHIKIFKPFLFLYIDKE